MRFAMILGLALAACSDPPSAPPPPPPPAPIGAPEVVLSYNPAAAQAARDVLAGGGNAFDAYVAATFVEYIVAPGVTSMAGPSSTLIYDAARGAVEYLDGDYNAVANPGGTAVGGSVVLVPGAVRALEKLAVERGRLPMARLLAPAIALARDGFAIDTFYATAIRFRAALLQGSEYGRATFFRAGMPLAAGEILRQPRVAELLENIAAQGSDYMYRGPWAQDAAALLQSVGEPMTAEDLAAYRAEWRTPWSARYGDATLYGSSGFSTMGLSALLDLRALERLELPASPHYSETADGLERVVQASRHTDQLLIEAYQSGVASPEALAAIVLSDQAAATVADRVRAGQPASPGGPAGSHSFHVMIADAEGNLVTGTNTISALPWGGGWFVHGVALNQGGHTESLLAPGARTLTSRGSLMAFARGELVAATGAFNSSLREMQVQLMLNLRHYGASADEAVKLPRHGTYPFDIAMLQSDYARNLLDGRVSDTVVSALAGRGLRFLQQGLVETGDGGVIVRHEDGTYSGAYSPASWLNPYGRP